MRIRYYPSRLSDRDLEGIIELMFRSWDQFPTFSMWMVESLQSEQIRRLERKPVEPFKLPNDWAPRVLAEGLIVTDLLSRTVPTYPAGRFADELHSTIAAMAAATLEAVQ